MQSLAEDTRDRRERERAAGDESRDDQPDLYPKEAIAATFLKIDRFSERLGAIRRQLADRRQHELRPREAVDNARLQRNNHADAETGSLDASPRLLRRGSTRDGGEDASYDPIKLPRLLDGTQPARITEPTFDGRLLSMDAMRSRASDKNQYDAAWERLQCAEQQAAEAVQEADRLTEEARIAMVLYAQNEKSWNFDERARRYQQVMQAKKEAEGARLKADDDRILVQCLRAQTKDPYRTYRSHNRETRIQMNTSAFLEPIISSVQETVNVWILASPLLTLPFTPRDASPSTVLAGEKELSTHVVYYAAASSVTIREAGDENDKPPSDGWLCCSSHGSTPAPTVMPVKSSIETWLVSGAGASHLNGKYLFSGTYNGIRKFKSPAGIELFRKELPKTSSIIRGVFDQELESRDHTLTERSSELTGNQSDQLPSTLRALEHHNTEFKAMEKVGAWMSSDTLQQKRRRMRDSELVDQVSRQDGDHVLTQETSTKRLNPNDVLQSRQEANADLCREWALFMRCSRRVDKPLSDAPKRNIGLGCLKRHYYISAAEKESMTIWAHEQEAWLEKDVLTAIIRREACVQRVTRSCQKCMSKFQQDLREETEIALHKILRELNTTRFLTVKVLEAIEIWRLHARKRGFTTYEDGAGGNSSTPSTLGWSASITVTTGKKLFKKSHAFASKFKRFCRPEDPHGQDERRLVYLGYYATRDEAELAYDVFANAEARRLNTTVGHLPRRRNVFRSCGKHFSVESERLGPDYCIECAAKQISIGGSVTSEPTNTDDWNPPFFYPSGQNYILKLGNDLDFLDQIVPLKARLNQHSPSGLSIDQIGAFPLLGNVFLLPKTPAQDPNLVFFTSLMGSGTVPPLHGGEDNQQEENDQFPQEALDMERVLKAQRIFLQEMQIYHPELFQYSSSANKSNQMEDKRSRIGDDTDGNPEHARRIVQALYWDRCAALRIVQERAPLPFRQENVWCRPDAGEWASLLVRGKHQQHVLFENRLAKAGKETQERRKAALKMLRKLLKSPIYFVPSRDVIRFVISEGEHVKGDVVLLEVKSAYKFLDKYDLWCLKAVVVQRWYRGVYGRRRVQATRRALHLASATRHRYMDAVNKMSTNFYRQDIIPAALRSAVKKLRRPMYSRTVKIDGELLIVSIHAGGPPSSMSEDTPFKHRPKPCICRSCARRFHVTTHYDCHAKAFQVGSLVCCCALNNPVKNPYESWVVRAYNPFSNVVYRLVIQNGLLSQLLRAQRAKSTGDHASTQNPLFLCASSFRAVQTATRFSNYIDKLATGALQEWTSWRILSDEATQRRKNAEIDLERARERVVALAQRFEVAIVEARRALDFTSRAFEEAQAWDPLENANDWRLLVQKRHTQKELSSAIDEAEKCRVELFQAKADESSLRVQSVELRHIYESYWKPLLQYQEAIVNECTIEFETSQSNAFTAMSRACTSQLALRDTFLAPTRRALIIAPTIWHQTDTTMARMLMIAIPGLQRGRNTLRRRAMLLSDMGKTGDQRCVRLIVDVSAWTTRPTPGAGEKRNIWMSAYNPATSRMQRVYLDWELVQLLATAPVVRPTNASERERWVRISDRLLSLCMLDRFTGEFTLRKLQFYHHLRLLRPQFLASRWFQDLRRGRKCGDGDEIFRQSATIDGRLCLVVVFENWGDLVVRVYRSASATIGIVRISLDQAFCLLAQKPLALHLWVCCVKSNQYSATAITTLLRFIRITADDDLVLTTDKDSGNPLATTTKPIYMSAKIQQRRVLLCFRDATGGDLAISAYDMTLNKKFQMLIEWENIRRVLKVSEGQQTDGCSGRRRNLTLARNRRELCEWITSRLSFQSLMEHPDVLASSFSPLVSGVQIRASFLLFNEWISTSVRNPLREMPQRDIDKHAAASDASLFRGLAHEQLAFVSQGRLPCSYNKEFLETRDFIAKGVAASGLGKSAQHLKVDFYMKAHRLFARVRHEIQQEVIARHEREERHLMEAEEVLALRNEIQTVCDIDRGELLKCGNVLRAAMQCITYRLAKTESLFEELYKCVAERATARGKKKPVIRKPKGSVGTKENESVKPGAIASMLLASVRQGEDSIYAILAFQRFGLEGTLRNLAHQIGHVEAYITETWVRSLEVLHNKASDVVQQDSSLLLLQSTRFELLDSHRALTATFEHEPCETEDSTEDLQVHQTKQVNGGGSRAELGVATSDPVSGFLLHPTGPIEEVMVEVNRDSAHQFSDVSRAVSGELMSMFSRPVGSRKLSSPIRLHVKRVPLGLVVFDSQKADEATQHLILWNSRATALAMEPVAGIAVFVPTRAASGGFAFLDIDSLYQSLTWFEPNDFKKPRPSSGAIGAARRRTVQRSKQLLPWKQLSVERMQTARRFRQQRSRMGLLMTHVDEDREREKSTLAVHSTSGLHVEWMSGGGSIHPGESSTLVTMVESLRLLKRNQWIVHIEGEHQMLQLFDESQQTQSVPSVLLTIELKLGDVRVAADDWRSPRRLVFSCQELQSRRQYYVDCSYAQLRHFVEAPSGDALYWPAERLSVHEWRSLALAAANQLVFSRKNGVLGLHVAVAEQHLSVRTHPLPSQATPPTEASNQSVPASTVAALTDERPEPTVATEQTPEPSQDLSVSVRCACDYELQSAIRLCRSRRFLKHQSAMRRAAATRQNQQVHVTMVTRSLPLEWLRMTQEDWSSQEYRGLLTLDEKEVKKIRHALSRVHQRRLGSTVNPSSAQADVAQWFMDIDNEMGVKEHEKTSVVEKGGRYEHEAESYLSRMGCSRWWNDKHAKDERLVLDVADVAEWWRQQRHVAKSDKNKPT